MAVRQRIFNSTAPFCGSSPAELKGSYPECSATEQETQEEEEEEEEQGKSCKLGFMACLNPIINKVLTQGSAEQVGEMPLKNSPFIAQASWNYCEKLDSICPSGSSERPFVSQRFPISLPSEHNNVACPTTASIHEPAGGSPAPPTPQKKTRKRPKRKAKKKVEEKQQRQRVLSGVPEQECGSSLIQIQEDSPFVGKNELSSSVDASVETSGSVYDYSHAPSGWNHTPCSLHSYSQDSDSQDSDSLSNGGSNFSLALCALRGNVSQAEPCYAAPFCKDVERDARDDEGEELSSSGSVCNEGIIFCNDKIQPVDSEYKEGREYVTEFVKEGSFGFVYQAQDVNTGFTFAVKKIPLKRFTSEEVGTWSALRSPRVLELFGVVREGPNILLLMDYKSGSLGQLIAERGRLPEDLSLHYMQQVAAALEHLVKKKVAHLDVKADNVLLSEDGRDAFLCDFGHAERLDNQGLSLSGSKDLKGTETHMAPEIVKGEPRGAKADVWSSCCMLLHMLNGCQPWTRYYTCRLFLKIANEPPPLREIPSDCGPLTAEVIKAGLHKDPSKRASASQMRERLSRALKEVEGLRSLVKGAYTQPLYIANKPPDGGSSGAEEEEEEEEEDGRSVERLIMAGRSVKELEDDDDEEAESKRGTPLCLRDFIAEPNHKETTVPELELRKLERDFYLSSLSQLHSAEMQEQLLSCLSSDAYSSREPWDKKDSGRWSLSPGDDFSSGVCSYNSQSDGMDFSVDLLAHTQPPRPCCFEGVDVCIRDFHRKSIRIRETRRVKVGHIATGISDQISERVFTLETQQGQQIAHDEEVQESGLKLCCVPAPDFSPAWRWRVRDGVLETR